MKILLVNCNPVVSRLFALCTRDAHIELLEVSEVEDAQRAKRYDLLFVDDASYDDSVRSCMQRCEIGQKVFISYETGSVPGFDLTLKKPFLPSQVLHIIENAAVAEEKEEEAEPVIFSLEAEEAPEEEEQKRAPSIFPLATEEKEEGNEADSEEIVPENPHILDGREIEKIKELLEMEEDEMIPLEEELSEEVVEQRKVEAITAQLIAEGLEIVEEDEIIETIDGVEPEKKKAKKKKKREKKEAELPFDEEEFNALEEAFRRALLALKPKKRKKLLKGKAVELKLKLKDRD